MKIPYKSKTVVVGIALLCTALGSTALTLSRVRGAVLVGQPLGVAIQVDYDPEEDSASFCFEADVFHADTKQDAGGVRVTFEAQPQSRSGTVRVTSSAIVNEPVVTVYLRAGCGQKTTRRYVLLADLQSEVESPVPARVAPALAPVPVVPLVNPQQESIPAARGVAPGGLVPAPVARQRPAAPSRTAPAGPAAGSATPTPRPAAPAAAPAKKATKVAESSRLKLETSELLAERDPALKASPQLPAAPAASATSRKPAAELWHAINSTPDERVAEWQRMQALEADIKALRALTLKNQETLNELTTRLQQSQERFPDWVVYGMFGLFLASLGALALMWRRRETEATGTAGWWQGSRTGSETVVPSEGLAKSADEYTETRAVARTEPPPEVHNSGLVDIDLDLDEALFTASRPPPQDLEATVKVNAAEVTQVMQRQPSGALQPLAPDSYPVPLGPTGPATRGHRGHDFGLSMPGTLRAINTEELFDIRQQADFFISLGQYDQAIQVLENCVEESGESSPLVYLDLLRIFHTLGRKIDYQQYREDFNLLFNGRVPEFAMFNEEGHGLEAYVAVISRITELWPAPEVIDVIEACIFRDPGDDLSQSFDLEAYRELLMLHAIAVAISTGPAGVLNTNPGGLTRVPFKTYSTPAVEPPATQPMAPLPELAIDFDLSSPQTLSGETQSSGVTESAPVAAVEFPSLHAVGSAPPAVPAPHAPITESGNLIDFDLPDPPARPGQGR